MSRAGRIVPIFDRHLALVSMPAVAIVLAGGVAVDRAGPAVVLAASAYSVAFGANRCVDGRRWSAMIMTGCGMTIVSFVGTLAGLHPEVDAAGTASLAAIAGWLARQDGNRSWGWLQLLIAYLLAAAFPGDAEEAFRRALLVAAGAAIQYAAVRVAVAFVGDVQVEPAFRISGATTNDERLHALRAAVCVTAALLASSRLGMSHGYWAPITAGLVLQPGLRDTWTRGLGRIGGTLAGLAAATIVIRMVGDRSPAVATFAVVAATVSFGLQRAPYPLFTAAMTMCVLSLLALGGAPVLSTDAERLAATLLGGGLAVAGAAIAPRRSPGGRHSTGDGGGRGS